MVVIGLGSNVGERGAMLDMALIELADVMENITASSKYETEALLMPNSPQEWNQPFLNMAVSGTTHLGPQELLVALKNIERKLGRVDRGLWAPREIDLDILAYGDLEIREVNLVIPHPELLNRYFALAPFAEVAPEHIIAGKTARQWMRERFP